MTRCIALYEEVYAYQDILTVLSSVNDPRVVEVITPTGRSCGWPSESSIGPGRRL